MTVKGSCNKHDKGFHTAAASFTHKRGRVSLEQLCMGKKTCGPLFFHFGNSKIANYWRQSVFLLLILFRELANNKICKAKNSKLLEMLGACSNTSGEVFP